jgi:hypothetical protein
VSVGILLIKTKLNFSSELDIISSKRSTITKYDGLDPEISGGRDNIYILDQLPSR